MVIRRDPKKQMQKIQREELRKIRNFPRRPYRIVPLSEIYKEKKMLRYAKMKYRTEPVYNDNGVLVAYKIYLVL